MKAVRTLGIGFCKDARVECSIEGIGFWALVLTLRGYDCDSKFRKP